MKKLFVLVFAIALCLGVLCVGASAVEEHDNHSDWKKLMQNDFDTNNTYLELESGNYYLGEDVKCTGISQIRINGSVTLCLNGHVLDLDTGIIVVGSMYSGLTFTLCDCSSGTTHGYIDSNGLWHKGNNVPEGATECDLTGGVVTGGSSSINGGGVYLYGSTFNMTGGNIAGNTTIKTGGGVYVHDSTFNMTGGTITGNKAATNGGGVMVDVSKSNSTFTMNGGAITGNSATNGGGVFVNRGGGTFNLSNSSITGNSATNGSGGGVYVNGGSFTMENGTNSITHNTAAGNGGGVYVGSGSFNMNNSNSITHNTAAGHGGGVYVNSGTFTIGSGSSIQYNTAGGDGGGLYMNGSGTLAYNSVANNTATGNGGGVYVNGSAFEIGAGSSISNNSATNGVGGGVYVGSGGTLTMKDGSITGNNATNGDGGGVYLNGSSFTMTGGSITGNKIASNDDSIETYGGGVYVNGGSTFIMEDGDISQNSATNGGGVYVYKSTFTMEDGRINNNTAYISGGGLWVHNSNFTLSGGYITNNTADKYNGGGAFVIGGTFTMSGGSITGNNAGNLGGGVAINSSFTMSGGTITGNNAGNRGGGVYASVYSYNLSGDQTTVSNGMEFKLSGNPTIKDNTVNKDEPNETTSNVDLNQYYNNQESATVFTIVGELSGESLIGVTMDNPGVFTSGWSSYMQGKDPTSYFFSDITGYHVDLDGVEAALVANTYTVVFDANGGTGTMPSQTFTYNTAQNLTANTFTRTGYTFAGWKTTSYDDVVYDDGQSVENLTSQNGGTVTLYAHWAHTVTFDYNDGSEVHIETVEDGDKVDKPADPTRTGYTFQDWYTDEDCTQAYSFDKNVTENITIYAKWEPITYTVVFDDNANDVSGEMNPQTFAYDETKALTANTFTRTGYTVIGWNTAADGTGTPYEDREQVNNLTAKNGDRVTLYAQWTANEYTVTFDPNGGEGIISSQSFTYDTDQKLTGNGFTRTGYTFDGWNTAADGTGTPYKDGQQVRNLTTEPNGTVTLYAQWTVNTYTVTLNLNNGKFVEGYQGITSYTYGTTTLLPDAEQVTRSGYRFEGWYADEKFQDGPYTQISAADLGNKTFYARWSFINIPDPNSITVT